LAEWQHNANQDDFIFKVINGNKQEN